MPAAARSRRVAETMDGEPQTLPPANRAAPADGARAAADRPARREARGHGGRL